MEFLYFLFPLKGASNFLDAVWYFHLLLFFCTFRSQCPSFYHIFFCLKKMHLLVFTAFSVHGWRHGLSEWLLCACFLGNTLKSFTSRELWETKQDSLHSGWCLLCLVWRNDGSAGTTSCVHASWSHWSECCSSSCASCPLKRTRSFSWLLFDCIITI